MSYRLKTITSGIEAIKMSGYYKKLYSIFPYPVQRYFLKLNFD